MSRFNSLRTLSGSGGIKWDTQPVTALLVAGYSFDATHVTLSAIQATGATVLATARLSGKVLQSDGSAVSTALLLRTVPAGGPYDIVLVTDTGGQSTLNQVPLLHYNDVVTLATSGDVMVKPSSATVGSWFQF